MDDALVERIRTNPRYLELTHKRGRFGWTLTAIMLVIYFTYIFFVAFEPGVLATPVASGAVTSVAIPVGIFVILSAIALTGIYVWRANGEFDRLTREIVEDVR
jgi:uncharacterized membrane protein (DUF485 family)